MNKNKQFTAIPNVSNTTSYTREYKIKETTYIVNSHFTGKQTLEDALIRMILRDIKNEQASNENEF